MQFSESTWASFLSVVHFTYPPLASIGFGFVILEGISLPAPFSICLWTSMNLSLSLNYLEVNPFGIAVQGMKLLGVCIYES